MNKTKEKVVAVIPARYASTRFPGKLLEKIDGKSILEHTWNAAANAKNIQELYIAGDDVRIQDACREFGARYVMTGNEFESGTDRIAFVVDNLDFAPSLIVNIQGDEPFITGELLDELIINITQSDCDVGTIITLILDPEEISNPNIVKVALSSKNQALYFSRSPIPYIRDYQFNQWTSIHPFYKHIGIYAYKSEALKLFTQLKPSPLEKAEKLEQLRLMEAGAKYLCVSTNNEFIGIDTPDDLHKAELLYARIAGKHH